MVRNIIRIDEEKCNGCGLCVSACHEGAIAMADGKAKLIRDDYCDGLGNCLPACPTGAISFEEREAAAFDEAAVQARMAEARAAEQPSHEPAQGCPGTRARMLGGAQSAHAGGCPGSRARALNAARPAQEPDAGRAAEAPQSELRQWPVQIKLAPIRTSWLNGAKLLIAADCAAYAYAGFHSRFMKNRVTLIGCPKLDEGDYAEKLAEMIRLNDIRSITVARMEVPCCGGLASAVGRAVQMSGKVIPWHVVVISTDGEIIDE
ncbi:MAG: 4Fe-4S binding protein [Clostridiales bacterium]|nr:4Fe-4S binding protein [Clostridiales bacterium]